MSKRSSPPVGRGQDPDRTDELPALDVKSYEASREAEADDTVRAEAVRIEPVSLGGDLRAISENIRTLEASLKTRAEQIARLEADLEESNRELSTLERRNRELEDTRRRLENEHDAARERVTCDYQYAAPESLRRRTSNAIPSTISSSAASQPTSGTPG